MSEDKKSFLSDFSKTMEIEIDNKDMISLLELMLDSPFNFILVKNIYTFLAENYKEIKVSDILTEEEGKVLELIHTDLKDILEAYDRILEEKKKESKANLEEMKEESEANSEDGK